MDFEKVVAGEPVDGIAPWFRDAGSARAVHNQRSAHLPSAPERQRRAKHLHRSPIARRLRQTRLEQRLIPTVLHQDPGELQPRPDPHPKASHRSSPSLRSRPWPEGPPPPELRRPCKTRTRVEYPDASLSHIARPGGGTDSGGRRASVSPPARPGTAFRPKIRCCSGPARSRLESSSDSHGHTTGKGKRAFRKKVARS